MQIVKETPQEYNIRDVNYVKFRKFDILKVYHYTQGKNRKQYMYKQVMGANPNNNKLIDISHLDGTPAYYSIIENGLELIEYKIVQSAMADLAERKAWAKKEVKAMKQGYK